MDEKTGQTVNDVSGNSLSTTLGVNSSAGSDDPTWTTGKYGAGLSFDGGDYVSQGTGPTIVNSISFWTYPTSTTNYFVDLNGSAYISATSGTLSATGFTTPTIYVNGVVSSTIVVNQWQYITVTTATNLNASALNFGKISTNYLAGKLDEVKLYNYVRNSKQITEDMNAGHPVGGSPVGSQVGYWKMDEGYGAAANNSGKIGKAIDFVPLSDAMVSLGSNSALNEQNGYTITTWIYPDAFNTEPYPTIFSKAGQSGTTGFIWIYQNSSGNAVWQFADGTSAVAKTITCGLVTGSWQHLVLIHDRNNKTMYCYVNGVKKGTTTYTETALTTTTGSAYIGTYQGSTTDSYHLDGRLDEYKIYNSALTSDEVKIDYNRGSAMVLGKISTDSDGSTPSDADSRGYCIPGDTTSCAAPVAEWKMDEKTGANAYDTSGNGKTGSISGANWISGKVGGTLNFDGINDYVNVTGLTSTSGSYTFEFWANPNTINPVNSDFFIDIETGRFVLGRNASKYQFYDGSWKDFGSGIAYSSYINSWHYYTFVFNSSNTTASLYIDGQLKGSNNTYLSKNIGGTIALMSRYDNSTYQVKGYLDQFRIFDYARTAAQIAWDYNRGGPVGRWKMDECQGITANDSSGNVNSGTITIGVTGTNTSAGTCTGSAGEAWKDGATGKYNSSLEFDGTDDYINIGSPASLSMTGPVTQSAWIKLNSIAVQKVIIGAETQYNLQVSRNSTGDISVVDGAGHRCITNGNAISSTSNWYHIVGIFSGTTTQTVTTSNCLIYVNGILQTSSVLGTPWSPSTLSSFNIGNWANTAGTTYKVNGQIDDVKIFNYALTANQVKNLYNQGSAIQFAPTTGSP